jgi:hypothetical protein
VQIANPSNAQQEDPKRTLVKRTLRAITGFDEPMPEKGIEVYRLFNFYSLEICQQVAKMAIEQYSDPFNKYPSIKNWRAYISDTMRARKLAGLDQAPPKVEVSYEERREVARKAGDMARYFDSLNNVKREVTKSPFALKVDRYKDHAERGEMLILQENHPLDGTWMSEADAERSGCEYRDPKQWLKELERKRGAGNIGGIIRKVI